MIQITAYYWLIFSVACFAIFLFLWFIVRKNMIKPPQSQTPDNISYTPTNVNHPHPRNNRRLSKKEQLLKELIEKERIDFEGNVKAFGTKFHVKTRKPKPIIPFDQQLTQEELDVLDKDYQKNMEKLINDIKPPQKNGEKTTDETPEVPKGGWKTHLKKQGVIEDGTEKE